MHGTDYEPLVNLPSLIAGALFGALVSLSLFSAADPGLRAALFALAIFLLFDSVFPYEGPPYIYEFVIAAILGFLAALASGPHPVALLLPAAAALVFVARRLRHTVR